jgi:hypothetical protein
MAGIVLHCGELAVRAKSGPHLTAGEPGCSLWVELNSLYGAFDAPKRHFET